MWIMRNIHKFIFFVKSYVALLIHQCDAVRLLAVMFLSLPLGVFGAEDCFRSFGRVPGMRSFSIESKNASPWGAVVNIVPIPQSLDPLSVGRRIRRLYENNRNHGTTFRNALPPSLNPEVGITQLFSLSAASRLLAIPELITFNEPHEDTRNWPSFELHLIRESAVVPREYGSHFVEHDERVIASISNFMQALDYVILRQGLIVRALDATLPESSAQDRGTDAFEYIRRNARANLNNWRAFRSLVVVYPSRVQAYLLYEIIFSELYKTTQLQQRSRLAKKMQQVGFDNDWIENIHEEALIMWHRAARAFFEPAREFYRSIEFPNAAPAFDPPPRYSIPAGDHDLWETNAAMGLLFSLPVLSSQEESGSLQEEIEHTAPAADSSVMVEEPVTEESTSPEETARVCPVLPEPETEEAPSVRMQDIPVQSTPVRRQRDRAQAAPTPLVEGTQRLPLTDVQRDTLFAHVSIARSEIADLLFDGRDHHLEINHEKIKNLAKAMMKVMAELGISDAARRSFWEEVQTHPSHIPHSPSSGNLLPRQDLNYALMSFIRANARPATWRPKTKNDERAWMQWQLRASDASVKAEFRKKFNSKHR